VCEAHAIVGCLRFLEGPYLLLVTRRRYLGALCGACLHACVPAVEDVDGGGWCFCGCFGWLIAAPIGPACLLN